jgi:hypothetical protein
MVHDYKFPVFSILSGGMGNANTILSFYIVLHCSHRALSIIKSHNIESNKRTILFPDILYYNILLINPTELAIHMHIRKTQKVNQLRCRRLLCNGSWYIMFWRLPTCVWKDKISTFLQQKISSVHQINRQIFWSNMRSTGSYAVEQ